MGRWMGEGGWRMGRDKHTMEIVVFRGKGWPVGVVGMEPYPPEKG
jgi:hypothetical protein